MSAPPDEPVGRSAAPRPPDPASNAPAATPATAPTRPAVPSAVFLEQAALQNQQQQRASMSSLMFMTFFFFMMSGGSPPMGMDEIEQRHNDIDNFGNAVTQLQLYLNGSQSNYSFSPSPVPSGLTLLPPYLHREHPHDPISDDEDIAFSPHYFQNVTGFYREADAHYLNLTDPSSSNSSHHFFRHLGGSHRGAHSSPVGSLVNQTSYNETEAVRKRGDFDWAGVTSWSININEKEVVARDIDGNIVVKDNEAGKRQARGHDDMFNDWTWVHVSGMSFSNSDKSSVLDYQLAGVHQRSTGEYTLLGMPAGEGIDIRLLPSLLPDRHARNLTGKMVLFEMQRHLARLRADPTLGGGSGNSGAEDDGEPSTSPSCPIQVHLRLLPVPFPYSAHMLEEYEREMRDPTGIYVHKPPHGIQIEGVAIMEECGVAYGLTGGQGIAADAFWQKSIHYAVYASVANLIILFLFVWEMEATRTPSALAKISFWSIVLMVGADAWLFSAHAVVAIMSDNVTTLPLLLPSFLCLCTALVFGPRFTVMLHRVQAPESPSVPVRTSGNNAIANATGTAGTTGAPAGENDAESAGSSMSRLQALQSEINRHPHLRWLMLMLFCTFLMFIGVLPQVVPLLLGILYSFWIPQIWRNARRGNRKSLTWKFVLGMSTARLALPLYAFGCPDNVFFVETDSSIWLLPIYVWAQVFVLWAQERFGASFFLPQRFAPPPPYDYHQPLPVGDSESGVQDFGNCSICMEPILVNHVGGPQDKQFTDDKSALASTATNMGVFGSRVMNINFRRTYALAPCHHLFHTDCLNQWMAIKNTCPLCKRGLPPL